MKMRKGTYFSVLVGIGISLLLLSCTSASKEEQSEASAMEDTASIKNVPLVVPEKMEIKTYSVPKAFQLQLKNAFTAYIPLKEALVSSDETAVLKTIKDFKKTLGSVDSNKLPQEAKNDWMKYMDGMETSLIEMEGFEDLEAQRGSFSILSDNFFYILKAFGSDGTPIYYDYCPMAFDNRGAHWLSDNSTIRNPYFGDKMLTCGSVEEVLE